VKGAARNTIILAALIGGGCSEDAAKVKVDPGIEQTRSFKSFPVYYAGEEVAGLPLTSVHREPVTAPPRTPVAPKLRRKRGQVMSFDFAYGSCSVAGGEGGCSLPLSIQVWPACARYPALYDWGPFAGPTPRKTRIRGVPAAYFEGGYRLEIQTGASTIVIFGNRKRMRAAVAALQGLNVDVGPDEKLPPPVPGALDGSLPCARQSGFAAA
jgi:hypothetical protein